MAAAVAAAEAREYSNRAVEKREKKIFCSAKLTMFHTFQQSAQRASNDHAIKLRKTRTHESSNENRWIKITKKGMGFLCFFLSFFFSMVYPFVRSAVCPMQDDATTLRVQSESLGRPVCDFRRAQTRSREHLVSQCPCTPPLVLSSLPSPLKIPVSSTSDLFL